MSRLVSTPPFRFFALLAVIALGASVFGWTRSPSFGGLGPVFHYLGFCASIAFLILGMLVAWVYRWVSIPLEESEALKLWKGVRASLLIVPLAVMGLEAWESWGAPIQEPEVWAPDGLNEMMMYDADLGWWGRPGFHKRYFFKSVGMELGWNLNSLGCRDLEPDPKDTRPLLLVIGDSLAIAFGVEMEEGSIHRLRKLMPEYRIMNMATTGFSLDQIEQSFETHCKDLKPAVVLLLMHWEIGEDQSTPSRFSMPKPFFEKRCGRFRLRGGPIPHPRSAEEYQVALSTIEADGIGNARSAWEFLWYEYLPNHVAFFRQFHPIQNRTDAPLPVSFHILDRLKRKVEERGAQLEIALVPTAGAMKYMPWDNLMAWLEIVRGKFPKAFDVASPFKETRGKLFTREFHLDPKGHLVLAKALAEQLRKSLDARKARSGK